MAARRVYVLLIGNKERGEVNHFQLLQEETALAEGRRLGLDLCDQLRHPAGVVPAGALQRINGKIHGALTLLCVSPR